MISKERKRMAPYQVLSQLDKNTAILLENLQGSLGATFVASLERPFSFFVILNRCPFIQRFTVTGTTLAGIFPPPTRLFIAHSLMHNAKAAATLPVLSAVS
jgi:hypothetical protein